MAEAIQGLRQLERKLERLARKSSPKVARAAMTAMATPLKQAIRRTVNGTNFSREAKESEKDRMGVALRNTIGSRVGKVRILGEPGLKVGFGVGRQSKIRKSKASERAGQGGGVGISGRNVHWAATGTPERFHRSGKSTGEMPPVAEGIIERALSRGAVRLALKRGAARARVVLRKEAFARLKAVFIRR